MKIIIRIISLLLILTIFLTTLAGCDSYVDESIDEVPSYRNELVSEIVSDILDSLDTDATEKNESQGNNTSQESISETDVDESGETESQKINEEESEFLEEETENDEDLLDFAYSLLIEQLEYGYNVFHGVVQNSDGQYVCGLAYYDYSDCYVDTKDADQIYIMCGFIPEVGEALVSEKDFNSGLIIMNPDYNDPNVHFVWKYKSDAMYDHCVVNGKYLTYGIDNYGRAYYETCEYSREVCDTSLGSLYSYDDLKYLYDPSVGEYAVINGSSLSLSIDYSQLEREINKVIADQDSLFASVDVESSLYISYEAVCNALLSLSEETFMGYRVSDLIAIARELDPGTCIEISPTGLLLTDIAEPHPEDATKLTKWLVGTVCVVTFVASMVASNLPYPGASALCGAVCGVAADVFMQVVFSGRALGSINWTSVAVSAVSGAISGLINPVLSSALSSNPVAFFLTDTLIDGVIAGLEVTVLDYIDGVRGEALVQSFGVGFALGTVFSAGSKVLVEGVKIAVKGAKSLAKMIAENSSKLTKKTCRFSASVPNSAPNSTSSLGKKIDDLKKVVSSQDIDTIKVKSAKGKVNIRKLLPTDNLSVDSARAGAKMKLEALGYDWNKIQRLKSNETALRNYLNSIPFQTIDPDINIKQLMAIATETYMPNSTGAFSKMFNNAPQSTGDSAEWYIALGLEGQGIHAKKEAVMNLAEHAGYKKTLFDDYEVIINKANRKSDVVAVLDGVETHIEIKVGKVSGAERVMAFAEEVVADMRRMELFPDTAQQYRIYGNADNGSHMLMDPKQARILLAAMQECPGKISVYLDDVLLSMEDVAKYAFPK